MFGSVPESKKLVGVAFSIAPNTPDTHISPHPPLRNRPSRGDYFFLFNFYNSILAGKGGIVKDFLGFFFWREYRNPGLSPENPVVKSC